MDSQEVRILRSALRVLAGGHACLLWLDDVIETMRPPPLAPAPGCAGLACVRGEAVPVLDLAALLGTARPPTRLVTIRAGGRTVGLLVDAVVGLVKVDPTSLSAAPPLLGEMAGGAVEAIRRADRDLALVLSAARLVPENDGR